MSHASTSKSSRVEGSSECPHCGGGHETFRCYGKEFIYDVDLAREIVSDGREPVEVDPDSVRKNLEGTRIHKQHLDHVDTKYPGIIAHVSCITREGEFVTGHVLIDGNHRAARCVRDGLPFFAYLLNSEESESIMTRRRPLDMAALAVRS